MALLDERRVSMLAPKQNYYPEAAGGPRLRRSKSVPLAGRRCVSRERRGGRRGMYGAEIYDKV